MSWSHRAAHANVDRWQLHYPDGTRFAEDFALTPEESRIPVSRYISAEFLDLEIERVWKRVWQMACREQEVASPGDYLEYRVGDQTFLVVRGDDGRLRAFHDACRHRGNVIKRGRGNADELRCGFHHWCWRLDGTLKHVPDRHLYAPIDDDEYALCQVGCDTWAGLVFIHPDPARAQPLREFLGPIVSQLEPYRLERMQPTLNATIRLSCNWKVAVEAFLEVYHVPGIHPQLMPIMDDVNTAYEVFGDHSRMVVPYGVPSMRLEHVEPSEIYASFVEASQDTGFKARRDDAGEPSKRRSLPSDLFDANGEMTGDMTVRRHLMARIQSRGERLGHDYSGLTEDQLVDDWHYYVFPGLVLNLHAGGHLLFRVRPDGHDPDRCLFDVMTCSWPDEARRHEQVPAPNVVVEEGTHSFGRVLDQDFANLPYVQRGLHSDALEALTVSAHEMRIVALHATLDRYLELG